MRTHNVTLTDAELKMIVDGLNTIYSDYCTSEDEERPYIELIARLTEKSNDLKSSPEKESPQ